MPEAVLTDRWTQMRWHDEQQRLRASDARFKVVPAGRRSGKTEHGKRELVISGMKETRTDGVQYIAAAPTLAQAKQIFWRDLLALTPEWFIRNVNRSDLAIELVNGALLEVRSLDRPERIEGGLIGGIVIDEIANCPEDAWSEHVRPALSTESCIGWAWLIGVPEGRNFYYQLAKKGQAKQDDYDLFTWHSADILPPEEIAAAKSELDPLTYKQEYEGSFITFEGRAYYGFSDKNVRRLKYDPRLDLIFCFDFNVKPGVAAVLQEQEIGTCVIGEVWIPQGSNTPMVCRKLAQKWEGHEQRVKCYGDSTGGRHTTSGVIGSDWEIIREELGRHFAGSVVISGDAYPQVLVDVESNPPERERVNAMNSRILAADETRRLFVDPVKAPNVVEDFEGVRLLKGGSGEIDKGKRGGNDMRTHLSDAIGYYVAQKFPLGGGNTLTFYPMD